MSRLGRILKHCKELDKHRKPRRIGKWLIEALVLELQGPILAAKVRKRALILAGQINSNRRRSRMKAAPGSFTEDEWLAVCRQYRQRCAYCHQKLRLTVDHVIPLSRGGSNFIANIVPACQSCNSRKGARLDFKST